MINEIVGSFVEDAFFFLMPGIAMYLGLYYSLSEFYFIDKSKVTSNFDVKFVMLSIIFSLLIYSGLLQYTEFSEATNINMLQLLILIILGYGFGIALGYFIHLIIHLLAIPSDVLRFLKGEELCIDTSLISSEFWSLKRFKSIHLSNSLLFTLHHPVYPIIEIARKKNLRIKLFTKYNQEFTGRIEPLIDSHHKNVILKTDRGSLIVPFSNVVAAEVLVKERSKSLR